jgi:hypothetical protein
MLAVIEVDKIREIVDLYPADRPLLLNVFFELFDLKCLLLEQSVAVHADTGRRNSRVPAGSRSVVAIETRNPVVAEWTLCGNAMGCSGL